MTDAELNEFIEGMHCTCWDGEPSALVFNAALTGFIANPHFHGPHYQGNALEAVRFAATVCKEVATRTLYNRYKSEGKI